LLRTCWLKPEHWQLAAGFFEEVFSLKKPKDDWLKRQQRLHVSDVAESFVSVTDVKHYVYCPRLVYFDRVLHATPVFGSQQREKQ